MSNKYVVKPEFRTNALHERGNGSTVTVYYTTGESPKVYTNIQYPDSYIKRIKEGQDYIAGHIDSITIDEVASNKLPTKDEPANDLPF